MKKTNSAKVISVIEVTIPFDGRMITQYWSLDGQMLAEYDPAYYSRKY